MALEYYDEAIYKKIQQLIKDPNMRVLKPEETSEMFRIKDDLSNDEPLKLPLIAISRDKEINLLRTKKNSLSFDGKIIAQSRDKSMQLNAIPVSLTYQLDIYTKFYTEGDNYIREFIFHLINHPDITIEIPYNGFNQRHVAHISILPNIQDNSDIPERKFIGQFTRWTILFELEDAYYFSIPFTDNWKILIDDIIDEEGEVVETASGVEVFNLDNRYENEKI